ncbi:hypothetical protein ACLKA7_000774 [Drosophila subpalustris]
MQFPAARSCSCAGAAMQASAVGRLPALNASTESGSEIEVWRTVQRKMTDSVVVNGAGAWNRLAVTANCGVAAGRLTGGTGETAAWTSCLARA